MISSYILNTVKAIKIEIFNFTFLKIKKRKAKEDDQTDTI